MEHGLNKRGPSDHDAVAAISGSRTIDEIRLVIGETFGDERVSGLGASDELVSSGLINSMETVALAIALEKHFGIEIPSTSVTVSSFSTLLSLADLVRGQNGLRLHAGSSAAPIPASVMRFVRRPVIAVIAILAALVVLDLLAGYLVRHPLRAEYGRFNEDGRRLYPSSGGHAVADFVFAVSQHEVTRMHKGRGPSVGVFGDSGTIGSYLPWSNAIPAYVETSLRARHPDARVFNLAHFGTFVLRDYMLLEAILENTDGVMPFDVVVFTLSDNYFLRWKVESLPLVTFNYQLLQRFTDRLVPSDRAPFDTYIADLCNYEKENRNVAIRWLEGHTALCHYGPFWRGCYAELAASALAFRRVRLFESEYGVGRRSVFPDSAKSPPAGFRMNDLGVRPEELNVRVVQIMREVIPWLQRQGVRVVFYLKPIAPKEWQSALPERSGLLAEDLANDLARDLGCTVVDLRWELNRSQFSDNVAHYNPTGAEVLGKSISEAVCEALER